ncbi:MAG TPA: septation protein IspZ [Caulobacteraceae bacterium]|jgi:intracellular septation protein
MSEAGETAPRRAAWVRPLVDFGGLAAFLVGYFGPSVAIRTHGGFSVAVTGFAERNLIAATWWLVAGSALALLLGFLAERRVAPLPLFGGLAALVFGGLTLIFHDEHFLFVKPTIINLTLGAVMLGGVLLRRNPLRLLFGDTLALSEAGWRRLTLRFGLFYLLLAGLNEVMWRSVDRGVIDKDVWVWFRFPGLLILTLLFALSQVPLMMKDRKALEQAAELEP